ncbi:MAG: manganese efflux pump [Clostridia bacterium]|nr:manganese efflux pump [Clostridia bacterium]
MELLSFAFFFNSALLGIGLAMDAFSVSLANGLNEPCMKKGKMAGIAGMFAFFQALMPMLGWICIHTIVQHFRAFEGLIPWIALGLLGWIGGKMLWEGIKNKDGCPCEKPGLGVGALVVQGIATSIDALSVGFTIAHYDLGAALLASFIIAALTFVICLAGVWIGKTAGTRLAGKAGILGGAILIFIGIEIFVTGIF